LNSITRFRRRAGQYDRHRRVQWSGPIQSCPLYFPCPLITDGNCDSAVRTPLYHSPSLSEKQYILTMRPSTRGDVDYSSWDYRTRPCWKNRKIAIVSAMVRPIATKFCMVKFRNQMAGSHSGTSAYSPNSCYFPKSRVYETLARGEFRGSWNPNAHLNFYQG